VLTGPRQQAIVPNDGLLRAVDPEEHPLVLSEGDKFPELAAGELEKQRRPGGRAGLPLNPGKGGQQGWVGRRIGRELNPDRDGVAGGGRGEIGWEQDPEHCANIRPRRLDARLFYEILTGRISIF
jgi:hypothetical protein